MRKNRNHSTAHVKIANTRIQHMCIEKNCATARRRKTPFLPHARVRMVKGLSDNWLNCYFQLAVRDSTSVCVCVCARDERASCSIRRHGATIFGMQKFGKFCASERRGSAAGGAPFKWQHFHMCLYARKKSGEEKRIRWSERKFRIERENDLRMMCYAKRGNIVLNVVSAMRGKFHCREYLYIILIQEKHTKHMLWFKYRCEYTNYILFIWV